MHERNKELDGTKEIDGDVRRSGKSQDPESPMWSSFGKIRASIQSTLILGYNPSSHRCISVTVSLIGWSQLIKLEQLNPIHVVAFSRLGLGPSRITY